MSLKFKLAGKEKKRRTQLRHHYVDVHDLPVLAPMGLTLQLRRTLVFPNVSSEVSDSRGLIRPSAPLGVTVPESGKF